MSSQKTDVLVIGATGFVGQMIAKYLAEHRQKSLFTLALAARSIDKLKAQIAKQEIQEDRVTLVELDIKNVQDVERAVKSTRVVINCVGPYWLSGTPVVAACARNGVHYVDLTGESVWIRKLVMEYDFLARQNGAIIVPSCGYDSLPSDLSAWLANKTVKEYVTANRPGTSFVGIRSSISAHKHKGGVSGGTISSMLTVIENVPKDQLRMANEPYSLSPVKGGKQPPYRLLYELVAPGMKKIVGGFWVMRNTNVWLVQRTFGLLELRALEVEGHALSTPQERAEVNRERYGPEFYYDEFMQLPSRFVALRASLSIFFGMLLMVLLPPVRALVKKYYAISGTGPSPEAQAKGYIELTNVTRAAIEPPITVKTVITGKGDPGYQLTAVMVAESALCLLLPQQSSLKAELSTPDVRRLTPFAKKGGILTPVTAFGEEIVTRLSETALFGFKSDVIEENEQSAEDKKRV